MTRRTHLRGGAAHVAGPPPPSPTAAIPPPATTRLPDDAQLVRAPGVHQLEPGVLRTPDPVRVLRLRTDRPAVRALVEGDPIGVTTVGSATARRLVDLGVARVVPRSGASAGADEVRARVTAVVPVRDRVDELERCLSTLVGGVRVLVVDDASRDPEAVAAVAARHGADVIRRPTNGGPGAARDTGLAAATTDLVAFVDSDVTASAGWLGALVPALDDPTVAVTAPRVASRPGASLLERYEVRHSPLDMGASPRTVHPRGRLAYLPSAVWLVRREALSGGFAPRMRVAEDVDALWRLHAAGWGAVYRPDVVVHHAPRETIRAALRQRATYATGATPLARTHPGAAPPLRLSAWSAVAVLGVASRRPVGVAAAAAGVLLATERVARDLPVRRQRRVAAVLVGQNLVATARSVPRAAIRCWAPLTVGLAIRSPTTAAALATGWVADVALDVVGPPVQDAVEPAVTPVADDHRPLPVAVAVVGRLLDDLAYATGLWRGAWTTRTPVALLPRTSRAAAR